MNGRKLLVIAEVEKLIEATKGSRNAARDFADVWHGLRVWRLVVFSCRRWTSKAP